MSEPVVLLITLPLPEQLVNELRSLSPDLEIHVRKANQPEEIPADLWVRADVLYTSRVLPTAEQAPRLRWIQFHWAGVDHAIEAPILRKPGLIATTLSGAAASQLAEYVVMMMLALGHRLPDMMAHQKRAEWPRDRWERFNPLELRDSTVGIIGYGSVGRQIARLLQPFGATVLASKRDAMQPQDAGYTPVGEGDPGGDMVYRLYPAQALRSMLKDCDFVAVTVPRTPETRGLIRAEHFAVMKPTAFLVDVSRGGIVDQTALLAALKDRQIAGAALDVFPEEPLPPEHSLWKLPNVIVTPHISGNTPHYDERALRLFSENLRRFLAGAPLFNRIDPDAGY